MASLPSTAVLGLEFADSWQAAVTASDQSVPKCSTPADCNARGTKALEAKESAHADSFFDQELRLAEDSSDVSAVVLALNNLAVSRMHQRDFLMAHAWIAQAMQLDSANSATVHNLRVVEASQRSFRWPSSPNATYLQYARCGAWSEIRITDASSARAKFAFSGLRAGTHVCSDFMPSLGDLEGELILRGKFAVYRSDVETQHCRIEIVFHGGSLSVQQQGGCGFGHGVYAAGEFERVSKH
jgi:hypothetical protein